MRVAIISGGVDYHPTGEDLAGLDDLLAEHDVTHVIHGASAGAEMDCHRHLASAKVWLMAMPAPKLLFDKAANARNKEMANVAHALTDFGSWEPARLPLWILWPGHTGNAEGLATHDGFEIARIGAQ